MNCPYNINNGENNILFKLGLLDINSKTLGSDRSNIFYKICIPLRLAIGIGIISLYWINNAKIQSILCIVLGLFSLISVIHLAMKSKNSKKCQWWSNNLEIFFGLLSLIACIYCFIEKQSCVLYVGTIFLLSMICGLIQSFIIKPFN